MQWNLSCFICQSWVWSPRWFVVKESFKLNCPQSRDQNCDPSSLPCIPLWERSWEPCVPLRGSLLLKWMSSLVLREKLNMNPVFPNVPNEVGVPRKADDRRSELGFENIISYKPLASRLFIPANILISQETQREMNRHKHDIKSLRRHLQEHSNFH